MSIWKKGERSQINNITFYLKKLENKSKPKAGRKNEIINIKWEMKNKQREKINRTKSCFFEKTKKLSALYLDWSIKKTYLNKIRNEKGYNTIDITKRIIRECYKQFCANRLFNLDEIDWFLERGKLPKLIQEEMEYLNGPLISTDWNCNLKLPWKRVPPRWLLVTCAVHLRE